MNKKETRKINFPISSVKARNLSGYKLLSTKKKSPKTLVEMSLVSNNACYTCIMLSYHHQLKLELYSQNGTIIQSKEPAPTTKK